MVNYRQRQQQKQQQQRHLASECKHEQQATAIQEATSSDSPSRVPIRQ
jgi:hypothetical protein